MHPQPSNAHNCMSRRALHTGTRCHAGEAPSKARAARGSSGCKEGVPQSQWAYLGYCSKRLLLRGLHALPYVALCSSVLALGLVAGFLLASPLAPQVRQLLIMMRCWDIGAAGSPDKSMLSILALVVKCACGAIACHRQGLQLHATMHVCLHPVNSTHLNSVLARMQSDVYEVGPELLSSAKLPLAPNGMAFGGADGPDPATYDIMNTDDFGIWQNMTMDSGHSSIAVEASIPG